MSWYAVAAATVSAFSDQSQAEQLHGECGEPVMVQLSPCAPLAASG
jgi:hypothetical protein